MQFSGAGELGPGVPQGDGPVEDLPILQKDWKRGVSFRWSPRGKPGQPGDARPDISRHTGRKFDYERRQGQ